MFCRYTSCVYRMVGCSSCLQLLKGFNHALSSCLPWLNEVPVKKPCFPLIQTAPPCLCVSNSNVTCTVFCIYCILMSVCVYEGEGGCMYVCVSVYLGELVHSQLTRIFNIKTSKQTNSLCKNEVKKQKHSRLTRAKQTVNFPLIKYSPKQNTLNTNTKLSPRE